MKKPFFRDLDIVSPLPLFPLASPHDHRVGTLVVASLETLGRLAPRSAGMAAARTLALAATHGMVDRIHRYASIVRPASQPALATGLAQ